MQMTLEFQIIDAIFSIVIRSRFLMANNQPRHDTPFKKKSVLLMFLKKCKLLGEIIFPWSLPLKFVKMLHIKPWDQP